MIYKIISGDNLINLIIKNLGYSKIGQKGSHVKLKNFNGMVIIIPNHKEIKIGTFNAIINLLSSQTGRSKDYILQNLFHL